MENELGIDESVVLRVMRRRCQDIRLGLLVRQPSRRSTVREAADDGLSIAGQSMPLSFHIYMDVRNEDRICGIPRVYL